MRDDGHRFAKSAKGGNDCNPCRSSLQRSRGGGGMGVGEEGAGGFIRRQSCIRRPFEPRGGRDGALVSRASLDETFSKSVARNFTAAWLRVLMFPRETSFIPFVVPLVKFDVPTLHGPTVVPLVSDAIVALLVVSRWTVLVEFL